MAEPPPSTQRRVDVSLDDDPAELRPAVSASRLLTTDDWDDLRVCAAETRELAIDEAWVLHPDLARRVVATVEGLQAEVARLAADLAATGRGRDALERAGDIAAIELAKWGMGDIHYSDGQRQEQSVVEAVNQWWVTKAEAEALRRAREHTVSLDPDPGAADSWS